MAKIIQVGIKKSYCLKFMVGAKSYRSETTIRIVNDPET